MLLGQREIAYEEINLARDPDGRAELSELTGMITFPQIVIDGETLGGFDELLAADRAGRLKRAARRLSRAAAAWPDAAAAAGSARRRRSPPPDDELADRGAAAGTRLALAAVDQEAVLERAARAVDVAEVVDRGPFGLDPGRSACSIASRSSAICGA